MRGAIARVLLASLAASGLAAGARAIGKPTATPTPVPRLTGGFGKPRATPTVATASEGQSLSDVVKAAGGPYRESPAKKGVTITNESLVTDPSKGKVTTGIARPTGERSGRPVGASAPSGPAEQKFSSTEQGSPVSGSEAEWREAGRRARQRVTDLETRIGELEAASKKLEHDFYSWDDGQYRDGVIKPAWDRTRQDLETARNERAEAQKELADLPEKARKAGVPPGWLRE